MLELHVRLRTESQSLAFQIRLRGKAIINN